MTPGRSQAPCPRRGSVFFSPFTSHCTSSRRTGRVPRPPNGTAPRPRRSRPVEAAPKIPVEEAGASAHSPRSFFLLLAGGWLTPFYSARKGERRRGPGAAFDPPRPRVEVGSFLTGPAGVQAAVSGPAPAAPRPSPAGKGVHLGRHRYSPPAGTRRTGDTPDGGHRSRTSGPKRTCSSAFSTVAAGFRGRTPRWW